MSQDVQSYVDAMGVRLASVHKALLEGQAGAHELMGVLEEFGGFCNALLIYGPMDLRMGVMMLISRLQGILAEMRVRS